MKLELVCDKCTFKWGHANGADWDKFHGADWHTFWCSGTKSQSGGIVAEHWHVMKTTVDLEIIMVSQIGAGKLLGISRLFLQRYMNYMEKNGLDWDVKFSHKLIDLPLTLYL